MKIEVKPFGKTPEGIDIELFSLVNNSGMTVRITNFGGIVTHLLVPDREGHKRDVVLGFDTLEPYLGSHPYFGAIVGRFANRISAGKFNLNGVEYQLAVNNGPNHLHGGIQGFDKKVWTATTKETPDEASLLLSYKSADMEEGYPGNLLVEVSYILNDSNELVIKYKAETDRETILNLTNHSYFNLNGDDSDILDHRLKLNAAFYTPVDSTSIPTGEILAVEGTPYDFRVAKEISRDWGQLENGYDHNFVLGGEPGQLKWFAVAESEHSGIRMEAATTEPGVQLYTSNYIERIEGKQGLIYSKNAAFCLETQHFPDSPNKPYFPSVVLIPGASYTQTTIYKFGLL